MKNKYRWKKGVFSGTYKIYSNDQCVGHLKDESFSQSAQGTIHDKQYTFKTSGLWKQKTDIIDKEGNEVIGNIAYNAWGTKAVLSIDHKTSHWKYDNIWGTKWHIHNSDGAKINFAASTTKGQVDSNTEDHLLLLCGLFVGHYYWQTAMVVIMMITSMSVVF